jgi:Recombination endonuclease VII
MKKARKKAPEKKRKNPRSKQMIVSSEDKTMKTCSDPNCDRSGQLLPLDDFYSHPTGLLLRQSKCKKCYSKTRKNHLKTQEGKRARRDSLLKNKYGIGIEEYESMLLGQNNKCAICGSEKPGGPFNVFHVDHNHSTGEVRGLLCVMCNLAVGWAESRINKKECIDALARYLNKWEFVP